MLHKLTDKLGEYHHGSAPAGTEDDGDRGHGKVAGALGAAAAYLHHKMHGDDSDSDDDHHGLIAAGALVGVGALGFFYMLRKRKAQDYVVVVDSSASMQSGVFQPPGATRWSETHRALNYLAPKACECDSDGVTLYFFNDTVQKFDRVRSAQDVDHVFQVFRPAGGTNLTAALDAAFREHFGKARQRPTSVLVIHDGEPNDERSVYDVLRNAANAVAKRSELSVSFIQVGEDPRATAFLQRLDTALGAKHDIVDTVKCTELQGKPFSEQVYSGLAS